MHPRELGPDDISAYLTHRAVVRTVAAITQNQALAALLYLYQVVLEIEPPRLDALRAQRPSRLPLVLSVAEVRTLLEHLPAERGVRHAESAGPVVARRGDRASGRSRFWLAWK